MASRRKAVRKRGKPMLVRTPEQERLVDLADRMEMPLAWAAYLVEALHYVGYAMQGHGEDGANAVQGIALSMDDTIETTRALWKQLNQAI
ncbi:MAG TPA: hypothetical protein VGF56_09645 [Rhizomicrobium sp.]|jgi:hypothetical protein